MAEPSPVESALGHAEQAVTDVSAALLDNLPDVAHHAALRLQDATTALTQALLIARRARPGLRLDAPTAVRLRALNRTMAQQREACLRLGGMAERALQAIVPAARSSTYQGGAAMAGYARGQPRQTGAFRVLSA